MKNNSRRGLSLLLVLLLLFGLCACGKSNQKTAASSSVVYNSEDIENNETERPILNQEPTDSNSNANEHPKEELPDRITDEQDWSSPSDTTEPNDDLISNDDWYGEPTL